MIKGKQIVLIPATLDDKEDIYMWCFHSETTKSHSGPPDYPNAPIATWEEFFDDISGYGDCYFTGTEPEHGRGFIISHDGAPIGFISYSSFHLRPHKAELDIWMRCEASCGKGLGTDAIIALGKYLRESLGIQELIMRPSIKNIRANMSYKKAGFLPSTKSPGAYLLDKYISTLGDGDYGAEESALLVKTFDV